MNAQQRLQFVRQRFSYRCGYCGVAEYEAGALLEIDHYRPLSAGGSDDLENLVYCCLLVPLTPRGAFHIRLLHLNRASLVELRRMRRQAHERRARWLSIRADILQILRDSLSEEYSLQEREEQIIALLQRILAVLDED